MLVKASQSKQGHNWDFSFSVFVLFFSPKLTVAEKVLFGFYFGYLFFLTQKHYSQLNLLPSVLVSEVTALET